VNMIQFGDKLQGLAPQATHFFIAGNGRGGWNNYRKRTDAPRRNFVFCMNQLGGVGAGKSQYKIRGLNNPDGARACQPYRYFTERDVNRRFLPPDAVSFTNATLRTAVYLWATDKAKALTQYGHISKWDVSGVTDMTGLFATEAECVAWKDRGGDKKLDCSQLAPWTTPFNDDISAWDVSSVTYFRAMFAGASSFNQKLNSWDVRSSTDFEAMFYGATSFNQDLNSWTFFVRKIPTFRPVNMQDMFAGATSFNGDIRYWDVTSVNNVQEMFAGATSFNQKLCWNVSGAISNPGTMFLNSGGACIDTTCGLAPVTVPPITCS
jgi:hypothetical protein